MVKVKSPFTYVFTLDDYHNQCVYFFRALLNNTTDEKDYSLLRNFYLANDDYYTKLLDALSDMFLPKNDEYLILAFSHIVKINGPDAHDDKKKAQYDMLRIDLYEKLFIQKPEKIEGFKLVHQVNFYL